MSPPQVGDDRQLPKWVRAALVIRPLPRWSPFTFAAVQATSIVAGLLIEVWIASWATNWKYLVGVLALGLVLAPVALEAAHAYLSRGRLFQLQHAEIRFLDDFVVLAAQSLTAGQSGKRRQRDVKAEGIRTLAPFVLVRDAEAAYAAYRTGDRTYRSGPRGGQEELAAEEALERDRNGELSPQVFAAPVMSGDEVFGDLVVVTVDPKVGPMLRSRTVATAALLAAMEAMVSAKT